MSFFSNLRADRLITQIKSSTDPLGEATLKAVAKLKELGPGAIETAHTPHECVALDDLARAVPIFQSMLNA